MAHLGVEAKSCTLIWLQLLSFVMAIHCIRKFLRHFNMRGYIFVLRYSLFTISRFLGGWTSLLWKITIIINFLLLEEFLLIWLKNFHFYFFVKFVFWGHYILLILLRDLMRWRCNGGSGHFKKILVSGFFSRRSPLNFLVNYWKVVA